VEKEKVRSAILANLKTYDDGLD